MHMTVTVLSSFSFVIYAINYCYYILYYTIYIVFVFFSIYMYINAICVEFIALFAKENNQSLMH